MTTLHGTQNFEANPQSVGAARTYASDFITGRAQLDALAQDIELITSELVTNAVRAVLDYLKEVQERGLPLTLITPRVQVHLTVTSRMVLVGVENQTLKLPERRFAAFDDEGGRGLAIVEALSECCGWTELTGGDATSLLVYAVLARPVLPRRRAPVPAVDWQLTPEFVARKLLGFRIAHHHDPTPAPVLRATCMAVA